MEPESAEYKTLIKCIDKLRIAFKFSLVSIADELLANGFVSSEAHSNILTTSGWGEDEKASRLVKCVTDIVSVCSGKYHDFMALPMFKNHGLSPLYDVITTEYAALAESTKQKHESVNQATQGEVSIDLVVTDRNLKQIKRHFSSLSHAVQLVLQFHEITVDKIHSFLVRCFSRDDWTQKSSTLDELFNALSVAKLWNYDNYGPLEDIAKHFLPNDSAVKNLIADYKTKLNGFYATTKIVEFIELSDFEDTEQDPEQPLPVHTFTLKDYRKLKLKLNLGNRRVSAMTLSYVDELWRSLAEEFDLPCLTAVIHSIIKGSLQITWLILPHIAEKIKTNAAKAASFLQHHGVALLEIEGCVIYDEKKDIMAIKRDETLFDACWGGHAKVARMQLANGANPNYQNNEGISSLYIASKHGHITVVIELLKYDAEVNFPIDHEWGNTALTIACENGYATVAKVLLEHKAILDHQNKKGMSPLYIVSKNNRVEVAKVLLEYGAQVNLPNNGDTALFIVSWYGHIKLAELLLDYGAEVDYQNKRGNSPLYISSIRGHVQLVKLLLNHGADVNLPKNDDSGYTSLMGASWSGHVKVAKELLDHGADVNYQSKKGASALYIASQNNRVEVVEALLKFGAQVNLPNNDNKGYTALIIACQNGFADLARILLDKGAAVDYKTKKGNTSLSLASFNNHTKVMEVLLEYGATVNLQTGNEWGDNSLIVACSHGHVDAAKLLLSNGALVNYSNKIGTTPLHAACLNGHSRVVELLIDRGASVNMQANDGSTPLHFAYSKNHIGAANVLLDADALQDIPDKDGVTSLMLSNNQELGISDNIIYF